jgi:thimet oligopeptidase
MAQPAKFTFDGSIDLETYRTQWQAKLKQLESDLELLKQFNSVPTAGDWGVRFDTLNCKVAEGANTGGVFKNVHPEKEFRDEGATADDAFENLSSTIEKDPILALLVQRMSFVDPAVNPHEQRFVERWQTIFKESGATLPEDKRFRLLSLDKHLTELRTQYSRNINDGQRDWLVPIADMEGMPKDFMKSHPANEKGQIKLTTRYADVFPVLMYCKNDEVRRKSQYEYRARCPENIKVLQEIIEGCHVKAQILGYSSYAALDFEGRLALKGLKNVNQFIDNVATISKPRANQEKQACAQVYGTNDLKSWQSTFAKEILLRRLFTGFDSSQIRPYLRVGNVLPQIALLIQGLFGVHFQHRPDVKAWAETGIECYDVYDDGEGKLMGRLYTDVSTATI